MTKTSLFVRMYVSVVPVTPKAMQKCQNLISAFHITSPPSRPPPEHSVMNRREGLDVGPDELAKLMCISATFQNPISAGGKYSIKADGDFK
ncbi:hypothetical protein SNOG_00515 [Parastagonospora nodorum SN15]|uniref:Uncharacterized protein n=1 Tax=Phaeosphaeria nodorum (strain SN15 / ATCC MYA-4574 / FGSC 10173) TaxID=321614 RepID=Q0V649_PHANO|nr:hypothetical protein SNOG_00515 [Parastagonospora nodorum SN15]EAT92010.1 hypothetical protein SNOG_00515 [Parastagonospora nodorum SN15]